MRVIGIAIIILWISHLELITSVLPLQHWMLHLLDAAPTGCCTYWMLHKAAEHKMFIKFDFLGFVG